LNPQRAAPHRNAGNAAGRQYTPAWKRHAVSSFSQYGRPINRVNLSFWGGAVITKTIRSRFDHEVGGTVEGCTILERHVVIPPNPVEQRRGVYDYLVEEPPAAVKPGTPRKTAPERGSFTRSTPDERGGVVRRLPSR